MCSAAAFPRQVGIWITAQMVFVCKQCFGLIRLVVYMSEGMFTSQTSFDALLVLHSNSSTGS